MDLGHRMLYMALAEDELLGVGIVTLQNGEKLRSRKFNLHCCFFSDTALVG